MTDPNDRRLELADQLRGLRLAAGRSGAALATAVGWAQSKVSRLETGKQQLTDSDITAWCRALDVPESVTAAFLEELRDIRLEESRWQRRLRVGGRPIQEATARAEQAATTIRVFELAVVPGLVQTADYAREVLRAAADLHGAPQDTEEAVAARIRRQNVLYDPTKRIELLVSEWALRTYPCPPEVMAGQVDRLLAAQGLASLRLGVIPLDVRIAAVPMTGFWIIDDLVVAETVNAEITVRDAADVDLYRRLLDRLWTVAVEGDQARVLLAHVARTLAG